MWYWVQTNKDNVTFSNINFASLDSITLYLPILDRLAAGAIHYKSLLYLNDQYKAKIYIYTNFHMCIIHQRLDHINSSLIKIYFTNARTVIIIIHNGRNAYVTCGFQLRIWSTSTVKNGHIRTCTHTHYQQCPAEDISPWTPELTLFNLFSFRSSILISIEKRKTGGKIRLDYLESGHQISYYYWPWCPIEL